MRRLFVAVALLTLGCGAQVPVADAYGECEVDGDCEDAARCETSSLTNVCRPPCTFDEDCPTVDGAVAYCGDEGERAGQCIIGPEGNSCPAGMIMVGADASPTSPLICVWES